MSSAEDSLSSLKSAGSFQEARFRLESVSTRLGSLYKLAVRIRNPRSRPQRPTKQLYKHIPEDQREQYKTAQEQTEILRISYIEKGWLQESVKDQQLQELGLTLEQLLQQYAAPTHWLIRRTGIANARRKQQFVYWKKHAELLGNEALDHAEDPLREIRKESNLVGIYSRESNSVTGITVPSVSMATSATKMTNLDIWRPEDMRSEISTRSQASTTVSPDGDKISWPDPPSCLPEEKYFSCAYCGILCPAAYLLKNNWR